MQPQSEWQQALNLFNQMYNAYVFGSQQDFIKNAFKLGDYLKSKVVEKKEKNEHDKRNRPVIQLAEKFKVNTNDLQTAKKLYAKLKPKPKSKRFISSEDLGLHIKI